MNFKNFDVFPIGNAELSIVSNKLRVCNKSNSGCDGVFIQNKDGKNLCISYAQMSQISEDNSTLRTSSLMRDGLGRVFTFSETSKRYDKKKDSILFGTNFSFLQNDFKIKGYLNNNTVFDFSNQDIEIIDTETNNEPIYYAFPWIQIGKIIWRVLEIGLTLKELYDRIFSKQTVIVNEILDPQTLQFTGYEIEVIYDPIPFDIDVNKKTYKVDSISFCCKNLIPKHLIGKESAKCCLIGEQVTMYNIPYIEIENIEYL